MTTHTLLPLCLALVLRGCLDGELVTPGEPVDPIPDAEYAVLSTIFALEFQSRDTVRLLTDSTSTGLYVDPHDPTATLDQAMTRVLLGVSYDVPSLKQETMQDFKGKNLTPTFIMNPSKIHPNCLRGGPAGAMPNALQVSRVGFDRTGRQAVAFAGLHRRYGRVDGVYYVLAYQNDKWVVVGSSLIFQS
jgi:hypothetical protein